MIARFVDKICALLYIDLRNSCELEVLIPFDPLRQTRFEDVLRNAATKFSRKLQSRIERVSSFFFIIQR